MDPILENIGNLLRQQIGLNLASMGSAALEHAVRIRMRIIAVPNLEDYWKRLINTNPEELQELIETITVPETWFFRQSQAFDALVDFAIKEWLPNHPTGELRVLSVPCATGEEAYSVVMALLDVGFPIERLSVDAVDISSRAIRQARNGFYRTYAFRSEDCSFRDRYFLAEGDGFRLKTYISSHVRFIEGNILQLKALPLAETYHIIFCRNLLIYLDDESRQAVVSEFATLLEASGQLFTGSAETVFFNAKGFKSRGATGSSGFHRDDLREAASHELGAKRASSEFRSATPRKLVRPPLPLKSKPKISAVPHVVASSEHSPEPQMTVKEDYLARAALLADKGQLDEAQKLCERYRQIFGDTGEAFYLLALIADARGEQATAEKFYRNTLYLDSEHLEALLHLASLLSLKGDNIQANQLRERAGRVKERKRL